MWLLVGQTEHSTTSNESTLHRFSRQWYDTEYQNQENGSVAPARRARLSKHARLQVVYAHGKKGGFLNIAGRETFDQE